MHSTLASISRNELNGNHPEVFNSWKAIARYLGCGVRTAQRWEVQLGLPVRRPRTKLRSSVIASRAELDGWIKACAMRTNPDFLKHEQTHADDPAFSLLLSIVELGNTFATLSTAVNGDIAEKNLRSARVAHESAIRFRENTELNDTQRIELNRRLEQLSSSIEGR